MKPGYIPIVLKCQSGLYWDGARMEWGASFASATKFPTTRAVIEYVNQAIEAGIPAFHEVGGIKFVFITNPKEA